MVGHGGSSAGLYLANPTSPIPSHWTVLILFKSVPVHQLSWLALQVTWLCVTSAWSQIWSVVISVKSCPKLWNRKEQHVIVDTAYLYPWLHNSLVPKCKFWTKLHNVASKILFVGWLWCSNMSWTRISCMRCTYPWTISILTKYLFFGNISEIEFHTHQSRNSKWLIKPTLTVKCKLK